MITRRDILAGSSAAIIAGAAPRSAWGRTEADVIIIGAGLAGLFAAHRLEVAGLKAVIIEGERRVGGRLHTLDDLPGKPDAGGIQVGSNYRLVLAIADDLKVGLVVDSPSAADREALFRINGQTIAPQDWAASSVNLLSPQERAILPFALGGHYGAKLPKFAAPKDWMNAAPALDISYAQALKAAGASAEAMRLIAANLNGNSVAGLSQVHLMRSRAMFNAGTGETATIMGGSQRLPEAMVALLKSPIRLGKVVTAIAEDRSGVTVTLAGGKTLRGKHAICTIPFAALRSVALSGSIAPPIRTLITSLPYTRASFAFLSATDPFWLSDGLPANLWSDDPLLGRVFPLSLDPAMLKVWITGPNADALDSLPPDQAAAEIIRRLETARPSAKGKIKVERLFSWQKSPMARGIYHHIGTGQAALLAQAAKIEGRRLHFAGEHLGQEYPGMEAALESGNKVARMIAAR